MNKVTQLGRACDFLTERLADGPVGSATLREEGASMKLSYSVLLRAAVELGITSTSVPGQFTRRTEWSLPQKEDSD